MHNTTRVLCYYYYCAYVLCILCMIRAYTSKYQLYSSYSSSSMMRLALTQFNRIQGFTIHTAVASQYDGQLSLVLLSTRVASIISTSLLFFIDLCTNECILLVRYLFDLVGSKVHHVYELVVGKAKPDRRKTDGRQNERSRCERRAHTHQTNASQLHVFLFSRAQSAH